MITETRSHSPSTLPGIGTAAVVFAWFALALLAGGAGAFEPGRDGLPIRILAALVAPPALFTLAYLSVAPFRDFVLSLDLRFLTAVQAWRVRGAMFLVLYAFGILPLLFAYPAGFGDMLVGAVAVFALMALVRGSPRWPGGVLALNVLGLIDFAGAVATGVLAGGGPLGLLRGAITTEPLLTLPLSLIPTFAVPLWAVFHIASLIQLRRLAAGRGAPGTGARPAHA